MLKLFKLYTVYILFLFCQIKVLNIKFFCHIISAISSNGIVSNMGPKGFSKIGAGMVGPERYRAGTSETHG